MCCDGEGKMAIGCGTCSLWEPIIGKWKFELWGIDIDEGKIEMAKKVVKDEGRIRAGDACNLSKVFPASFFDIVVSTQVFYQIGDLKKVLEEIYLVLKPRGKLLFTTELPRGDKLSVTRLLFKLLEHIKGRALPKRRDEKEMAILLQETGFEVQNIRFHHIPPFEIYPQSNSL